MSQEPEYLNQFGEAFKAMLSMINNHGVDNFIDLMAKMPTGHPPDICCSMVCDYFEVEREYLMNSVERNDKRKYSVATYIYLLKNHCGFSNANIERYLKKDKAIVSRALATIFKDRDMYTNAPTKLTPAQRRCIELHHSCEQSVVKFMRKGKGLME